MVKDVRCFVQIVDFSGKEENLVRGEPVRF